MNTMNKRQIIANIDIDMKIRYHPTQLSPIRNNINLQPFPELNLKKCLQKCIELEQTLVNTTIITGTECPICYNLLGDTDCVIPKCGHKTCISCFVSNITHNKYTGDCCVLCRKKYA
jgi:hypothetical protein